MTRNLLFGALALAHTCSLCNAAPITCKVGQAYSENQKKCVDMPTWTVPANASTTFTFSETWAAKTSASNSILPPVKSPYTTEVRLSHDKNNLYVNVRAFNISVNGAGAMPISFSDKTTCNGDIWKREVLEVFITKDVKSVSPSSFIEFQVNPLGHTFLKTMNIKPNGEETAKPLDCSKVPVTIATTPDGWAANITLPKSLIGKGGKYRANFFRVQVNKGYAKNFKDAKYECNVPQCSFIAASLPQRNEINFHAPSFFGNVVLGK